jgi:lysophospholipase L1-like esterase
VESYVVGRYPEWKLAFRNAGIGGDTSTGGNSRTQRDVLSFNPTAVTITFGMNDGGYRQPHDPARLEAYVKGLQGMLDQLKAKSVRVAVLSSSPVEKKEEGKALEGYNQTLEIFAENAKGVATRNGALFVDQFHPHLAAIQKARDANPAGRINGGDAVHPGPSGQILMAWAILKGLGAPAQVSSATVDAATGRAVSAVNATVLAVHKKPNGVSFIRSDRALPLWIPEAARSIFAWAPITQDLNQYPLSVAGLPTGNYRLLIDDEPCGTFTAAALSSGINLGTVTQGPIARQAAAVQDAVFAKNRYFHDQVFRGVVLNKMVPDAQKAAMAQERMQGMPALEQALRDTLTLRPHRFEVVKQG